MKTQIAHQSFSFYAQTRSENWLTIVLVSKASLFSMLLMVELAAGHSSKSGRFEKLQEYAFTYTFIIKSLDMVPLRCCRSFKAPRRSNSSRMDVAAAIIQAAVRGYLVLYLGL